MITSLAIGIGSALAFKQSTKTLDIRLPSRHVIHCEVADTPKKMARGLMYRTHLKPDHGMIFVAPNETSKLIFWMKNTYIPLDIIWLNHEKKIVYISANTPPCPSKTISCPTYSPPLNQPVQYVLEINAGLTKRLNLTPGKYLSF